MTSSRTVSEIVTLIYDQVSSVADEPARRAASRQTCCKQRWTLSVINLRPNQVDNVCDGQRFRASYLSEVDNFNLPYVHLTPPSRATPFEFCRDLRCQITKSLEFYANPLHTVHWSFACSVIFVQIKRRLFYLGLGIKKSTT